MSVMLWLTLRRLTIPEMSHLGLDALTLSHKSTGKTILVLGGCSSVESTAIQLASAAGVTVATTPLSYKHDYV